MFKRKKEKQLFKQMIISAIDDQLGETINAYINASQYFDVDKSLNDLFEASRIAGQERQKLLKMIKKLVDKI